MFWVLLFSIIVIIVSGGNSPFLIPKLDKYVKTHVQDDTKKGNVLELLKEAKGKRKANVKANKKLLKEFSKIEKVFIKWEKKISKTIVDENKRAEAIESVKKLKSITLKNYKKIQDELMNKNSVIYQYKVTDEKLIAIQGNFIGLVEDVFQASISTHFDLLNLTTLEEWKKIY